MPVPYISSDDNLVEVGTEELIEKRVSEVEKSIKLALKRPETYFYTLFLEELLKHSTKYVQFFEKDELDVTKVYDHLRDYCDYYINKLRKFEHLGISTEEIMRNINSSSYQENIIMTNDEYSEDFATNFPKIYLSYIELEAKCIFLENTKSYYKTVLVKFK